MQLYEPFSPEIFTDIFKEFARPMRFEFAALAPSIKLEVSEKDDAEKSTASYENGVLELTLPKLPSSAARDLKIQ
jgi:HSP20 family molecular chaperone IbpA